jgi:hypothetical protein
MNGTGAFNQSRMFKTKEVIVSVKINFNIHVFQNSFVEALQDCITWKAFTNASIYSFHKRCDVDWHVAMKGIRRRVVKDKLQPAIILWVRSEYKLGPFIQQLEN